MNRLSLAMAGLICALSQPAWGDSHGAAPTAGEAETGAAATAEAKPATEPAGAAAPEKAEETPTEWKGLPILDGAYEAKPVRFGYAYKVNGSIDDVMSRYQEKLTSLQWEKVETTRTERNPLGKTPAGSLVYKKDASETKIIVMTDPKQEYCLVVLTLTEPPAAKP